MKKLIACLTALLLVAVCLPTFAGPKPANQSVGSLGNPGVAPPQSMPYGKSYSEWSTEWWIYAITTPPDIMPFGYGMDGTVGQHGPVWFLGGTFTGLNLTREVTVPAGTALFFPVYDAECSTFEPPPFHGDNEAELRSCAKWWVDHGLAGEFGPVFCTVDGVELKNLSQYRAVTPPMHFVLPAEEYNPIFGLPVPGGQELYSVGDGAYILLLPMSVGVHTIEFQNIHYTITIVPR